MVWAAETLKQEVNTCNWCLPPASALFVNKRGLFLFAVAVTAHEFVYAACGVDEFLLAGEERV